jgi:DNA polymerase-3 subunit gamma/tau
LPIRSGPKGSSRNNDSGLCGPSYFFQNLNTRSQINNINEQINYRVLARKYRPIDFKELIGQDTLVKTLQNSLNKGRLAHAFLLTGIRGVGKTTTARIIAKALNCIGEGNNTEPTFEICNKCSPCRSINKGNFLDVIEVDAASRTGVDGIREIIDAVMYSPNDGRYKVYIIDEVHMLSNAAFNALLKTLEEPPENVKFIFATTEIRKIPATIISRCQRFDLQRVNIEILTAHLEKICKLENIFFEQDAIHQICKASEGSVRDSLSLLDQAASLCNDNIKDEIVINMLGLNGYENNIKLIELCLLSDCSEALKVYDKILYNGIQPIQLINNLLEVCHYASKLNVIKVDNSLSESFQKTILNLSSYGLPKLVRLWQILIKGIEELRYAPSEYQAGSMIIIKLCYASSLPDPGELVKKISNTKSSDKQNINEFNSNNNINNNTDISNIEKKLIKNAADQIIEYENPKNFDAMLKTLLKNKEVLLHAQIVNNAHLVKYEEGFIEIRLKENTNTEIIKSLSLALEKLTNIKWIVKLSTQEGDKTVTEKKNIENNKIEDNIKLNTNVAEVFKHFPEAEITSIKNI